MERAGSRGFWMLAVACVVLGVAVAYRNAPRADLLFDSARIIREDPRLRVWEWSRIQEILLHDYWFGLDSNIYRPLTTLSYAFNYSVLGDGTRAAGYVAVNLVIHAIDALLVVALVLGVARSRAVALVAGSIFAIHPIGTEAVTNVVGRADLLAAAGVLAGLLLHVAIVRAGRFRISLSAALALASAVAIGSKESGIVLIGAIVLHDVLFGMPPVLAAGPPAGTVARRLFEFARERFARSYAWCVAPVVAYMVLRAIAFSHGASPPSIADNPLLMLDPLSAQATAAGVALRYLGLLVWPARLSADYSYDAIPLFRGAPHGLADASCLLAGLFLVGAIVAAIALRRRSPAVAFLVLLFFVTFAPVSNFFVRIGTIMAERLVYLPSVGPIALLSWALVRVLSMIGGGRPAVRVVTCAGVFVPLFVALSWRTASRNRDWQSGVALFASAVDVCPQSFKAHRSLAAELYLAAKDDDAKRQRIDEILAHAEIAWRIMQRLPKEVGYSNLLADLATYDRTKSQFVPADEAPAWRDRARATYVAAIEAEEPSSPKRNWRLHLGLAELLRDAGRTDEALARFEVALELAPGPEVLAPDAALLATAGRDRAALLCAMRLISLQPANEAMWQIVRDYYSLRYPGESTVRKVDGAWRFDTEHPAVAADLRAAVRAQYDAASKLGPDHGSERYRDLVRSRLGIDPAAAGDR